VCEYGGSVIDLRSWRWWPRGLSRSGCEADRPQGLGAKFRPPQGTSQVRPDGSGVPTVDDHHAHLDHGAEDFLSQTFVAQLAVAALDEAAPLRLTQRNVMPVDACAIGLFQHSAT
jgi:hypothetical protein